MEKELQDVFNKKIIEESIISKLCFVHEAKALEFQTNYLDYVELEDDLAEEPRTNNKFDEDFLMSNNLKGAKRVGIKYFQHFEQCEKLQVTTSISKEQVEQIEKVHDVKVDELLKNTLINEISQQINRRFIGSLDTLATKSYLKRYTKKDKFLSKLYSLFNKSYVKKVKIHNERELLTKILIECNFIAATGRFGPGNFAICNAKTATMLENLTQYAFTPAPIGTFPVRGGGIYPIGMIAGITIYVNPYMLWADNTVFVGRISKQNTEVGLHFAYFPEATEFETVPYMNDFTGEEHKLKIIMACKVFSLGNFPENQYSKFVYKEKKEHWIGITVRFKHKTFRII